MLHKTNKSIIRFNLFRSLTPLEAGIIERSVYKRKFKAGERIVQEGDAAVGIYLINTGEVKIYKSIKNRQIEIAVLTAGSFFGELTLLRESPRTATVTAAEPTELLCLFRPEFLEILHHYPAICAKFLPNFSQVIIERINNMHAELQKLRPS